VINLSAFYQRGKMTSPPQSSISSASSDAELIEALKNKEQKALSIIYDRYSALVYSVAKKILNNDREAEDLAQDIFLSLWRKPNFDPKRGSLSSYLGLLTRSRSIDKIRARNTADKFIERWEKMVTPESLEPTPLELADSEERREIVRNGLDKLPENQKQILDLLYYQSLTQAEIASRLNIPIGTVKTRSRQGLLKLTQLLSGVFATE
jgi:RNA polymerase sigma-70 factor (ECF subfamily)